MCDADSTIAPAAKHSTVACHETSTATAVYTVASISAASTRTANTYACAARHASVAIALASAPVDWRVKNDQRDAITAASRFIRNSVATSAAM